MESNRLSVLAADVKNNLAASALAERSAADSALAAGAALCEAKDLCKHGEWLPFLREAGIPERKAQRYMQLSRSGLKSDTVSDLGGIKATLRWLDELRLPSQDEIMIVTLGEGDDRRTAIVSQVKAGVSVVALESDLGATLRRSTHQGDAIWPSLFSLFGDRRLRIAVIDCKSQALKSLEVCLENFISAIKEVGAPMEEFEA